MISPAAAGPRPPLRLLTPVSVGSVEVKNRVVSTAHGAFLDFYRPGEPADRYVAYQERRAAGGCGLIILQPMHVHPSSGALGHYLPDPDDIREKFAAIAKAVHRHGAFRLLKKPAASPRGVRRSRRPSRVSRSSKQRR